MQRPTPEKLRHLREHYAKGCRVRLIQMDDPTHTAPI